MSDLPQPFTSLDCDLTDFSFMPLDVARLRDSELASSETPEACWAAVLLWAASWHQVPAASIPDEEMWIAKVAGYQLRGRIDKAWASVRQGALRGWVKCSDGRLYHPVVAEKAREAWGSKLEQRWRTECARIKKHNDRHPGANVPRPTFEEWTAAGCPSGQMLPVPRDTNQCPQSVPSETPSKGQGEGQGQGQGDSYSVPIGTDAAGVKSGDPPPTDPPKPAKPPMEPDEIIFGYGVPLLVNAGSADKAARSFLGGLRKQHGDTAVIDKLRECIRAKPLQPLEWLAAALPPPASGRAMPRAQSVHDRRAATIAGLCDAGINPTEQDHGNVIDAPSRIVA